MNLFWLDEDPFKSVQYHCDKHVVKMPTEYKQMLCTAHRVLDGTEYYGKTANGRKIILITTFSRAERRYDDILLRPDPDGQPGLLLLLGIQIR